MSLPGTGGGFSGGTSPASGATPPATSVNSPHALLVTLAFESAGILTLVIVADMNENIGTVLVALMIGWFIIFLLGNNTLLQKAAAKV